jgi:ribosomal protein L11 methyltransferase
MSFGQRTWIVPWNHDLPEAAQAADAAVVRLDPGLAFGSGTHPTTALCLRWLDQLSAEGELEGRTVLDFGCGSGILALAALKLGAGAAVGVDNDPQALIATADNGERNGVHIAAYLPEDEPVATYPVVVANILASALDALAELLATPPPAGGSPCPASCMARRANCWNAMRPGSTSLRRCRTATGCASPACAVLEWAHCPVTA